MDTVEIQKELVQFLLKRLKACALKDAACTAVFATFTKEGREKAELMLSTYRKSDRLRQTVENGFHDLDLLIQQVSEAVDQESVHKLLQQFDTKDKIPN